MSEDWYDTAQKYKNGHMINPCVASDSSSNEKFCSTCGAPIIMNCQHCNATIRGYLHMTGIFGFFETPVPKYCYNCGGSFPWTESKSAAANENYPNE